MTREAIRVRRRDDGVAVIAIDVPGRPNHLEGDFALMLTDVLADLRSDQHIRAAVLMSGKPDSFIVGADLHRFRDVSTQAEGAAWARAWQATVTELAALEKPVVAAVHGPALGGGFEVALACHARVMSDDPKTLFALSEVALGLMPAANGLQRLMDLAGLRVALDYGVTGKPMSPAKAKQLGVANDVVPVNRLEDVAARLAGALASGRSRAEQAGTAGARRRPEWLMRRLLEANPAARRMLCRQARKGARIATGGHHRAPDRIIDVLWAHAARGPTASTAEAARAMGELLVSTPARRLMELSLAVAELRRELGLEPNGCDLDAARGAFRELERAARPMMAPYLREAECLIREGATMDWVDSCLVDWGWPAGTLPAAFSRGVHRRVTVDAPAPTVPREEVQMRCTLQFVNEALFCLGGGAVRCPRDGDVGAVLGLGFPAFRGGPFRYVDAVGAREILRRVEGYQARFGQRWTPAPLLVELANADRRLYPRPLRLSTVTT